MNAAEALQRLADTINAHNWDGISELLHPTFVCHLVATNEQFDAPSWIAFNANYPGFQSMKLIDLINANDRAAARGHVTGVADGVEKEYSVAQFARMRDGLIEELVEVWADLDDVAPPGTR
ncbi:nuclear transport factor 2 family protein [Microbacterium sp.]|uniref:nuclear transport factor 2 family protein n=1 Tax=Microbacterium sp. TaxID=51671 RepID=UPI003F973C16